MAEQTELPCYCDIPAHMNLGCPLHQTGTTAPEPTHEVIARLSERVDWLQKYSDALVGETFGDRVHAALQDRARKAETESQELRDMLVDLLTKCTCAFNDCTYHHEARAMVGLDRDNQPIRDDMETVGPDGVTRASHPAPGGELPSRAFYVDDDNGRMYRR